MSKKRDEELSGLSQVIISHSVPYTESACIHKKLIKKTKKVQTTGKQKDYPLLDLTKIEKSKLLISVGLANGKKSRIVFDGGAQCSCISRAQVKLLGITTTSCDEYAQMPNGECEWLSKTVKPVTLEIGNYVESMNLFVCNLENYDIILGKDWHNVYNPDVDFPSNKMSFKFRGRMISLTAIPDKQIPLISKNAISRSLKRGNWIYAVIIRKAKEPIPQNAPQESKQILEAFKDVFPENLPSGLPPERSVDFDIKLTPGATPQKKGIYRMSESEHIELKKQV